MSVFETLGLGVCYHVDVCFISICDSGRLLTTFMFLYTNLLSSKLGTDLHLSLLIVWHNDDALDPSIVLKGQAYQPILYIN